MQISKCVGIDFGTKNSVIAMMADDNETIICLTDKTGCKTIPSAIVSIKSYIGNAYYRVQAGPLTMSPVEVSAEILKELKSRMEEYLHGIPGYENYIVDRAVITIPAYFAAPARENTTKAGELAGLKVEFTLPEPAAAALYYCHQNEIENGIFMVYDLGGGTFDVSIVRVSEGDAYVLSFASNNYLSSDNFDDALARFLLKGLQESNEGYDLKGMNIRRNDDDRCRFERLKLSAEIIKKALSSREEYFESTDGIFEDKSGAKVNLAASVTREDFEDLIRPLIESTLEECRKALREAEEQHHITLDMIDGVLLVGGSAHIPLVAEIIEENFTSPSLSVHTKMAKPLIDEPDLAVGYGAAIAAASIGIDNRVEVTDQKGKSVSLTAHLAPAVSYGGIIIVKGSFKAEGGDLPDGIYARVTRIAGGFSKEYIVNEDGTFLFEGLEAEEEKEPYSCSFIMGGRVICRTVFDAAPLFLMKTTSPSSPILWTDEIDKTISEARSRIGLINGVGERLVKGKLLDFFTVKLQDAFDAGDVERASEVLTKIRNITEDDS